ncbi:MAG: phosphatase PAP2 family protein [Mycobacterium sp.]|nr:phosphatase PAP2 family protein [Mycobacterium sp.]
MPEQPPGPPVGEVAALVGVQSALGAPGVVSIARAMSHFGEHAAGWVGLSAAGALLSRRRRRDWLLVGVGAIAAHAAAIVIKMVVRRARPNHPDVQVNAATPSALSFPSAHATSSTAAAILLCRATRSPLPLAVVPLMAASRLVLGVHYPSDVVAGLGVGTVVAGTVAHLSGQEKESGRS